MLTAADIEILVDMVRQRLQKALEDRREILMKAYAGIRDKTDAGDMFRTFEPDGRFSVEIHIGGGVDPINPERPR